MNPFGLMRHPRAGIHPPPAYEDMPQDEDIPQDDIPEFEDIPQDSTAAGVGSSSSHAAPMPGSFPDSDPADPDHDAPDPYRPSVLDVVVAKAMMHKALTLPLEIVDRIIDFAEYWPHTSVELDYRPSGRTVATGNSSTENEFLLRTLPLGFVKPVHPDPEHYKTEAAKVLRLSAEHPVDQFHKWIGPPSDAVQHPCRKIVFTITSNDQGWGGQAGYANTYGGSYTWFEAGLERIDASGECGDDCPDHTPEATDESSTASTARPHISPCAMRPIIPAVLSDPHERPRLHHPLQASEEYKIQCNKTAVHAPLTYTIEWRADDDTHPDSPKAKELSEAGRGEATATGEFVRNLKLGDVVTVWAKARFSGWSNTLRFLKVDVYWAV